MVVAVAPMAGAHTWYETTDGSPWVEKSVKLSRKAASEPVVNISGKEDGVTFKAWGTCFNELDGDALAMLAPAGREEIYHNLFAPDGDLRFTRGRLSMNANDYSRGWYSCSPVAGDFGLKYFNIERDKETIIPMIHAAQRHNPAMTFWVSPWCPPAWMKINGDYPVVSSRYNNLPKHLLPCPQSHGTVQYHLDIIVQKPDQPKSKGNKENRHNLRVIFHITF